MSEATRSSGRQIAARGNTARLTVLENYQKELQTCSYHSDPAQLRAAAALERCATEWAAPKLAMRALVAEEGVVLKGQRSLLCIHFLTHTCAELENFHWRKTHAA